MSKRYKQLGLCMAAMLCIVSTLPQYWSALTKQSAKKYKIQATLPKNRMYTRRPMPGLGAKSVPQSYFGFSSGPIAVGIAALDRNIAVYLIGFDMGPAQNNRFNNVYADTQFYKKSNSLPTYTGNWARQLATVIKDHPKVSFYRVQGETTASVNELNGLANLRHMPVADFLNRINNTKDL
jgi:hypothetical protein